MKSLSLSCRLGAGDLPDFPAFARVRSLRLEVDLLDPSVYSSSSSATARLLCLVCLVCFVCSDLGYCSLKPRCCKLGNTPTRSAHFSTPGTVTSLSWATKMALSSSRLTADQ